MAKYVIGLDYGTDSARCVIVDAEKGDELATSVMNYPRWTLGKYCDPSKNQYRQHPLDYLDVLEYIIGDSLSKCKESVADDITGIAIDTTGSTPVLTDENGVPLAMKEGFEFVQIGRATIKDPGAIRKMQSGEITGVDCDHCNRCVAAMAAGGVFCVSESEVKKRTK